MELLLNLAWLLLAFPAYWLWRGRTSSCKSSLQCLLSLGCLLAILFPVISATDDLCAMNTEVEESAVGKRNLRHPSSDKGPLSADNTAAVAVASALSFSPAAEEWLQRLVPSAFLPVMFPTERSGRAPPSSFLS